MAENEPGDSLRFFLYGDPRAQWESLRARAADGSLVARVADRVLWDEELEAGET